MKKVGLVTLVLLIGAFGLVMVSGSSTAASGQRQEIRTPLPSTVTLEVLAEFPARRGPGLDYPALDPLPLDTPFNVQGISMDGYWLLVKTPDGFAWVPNAPQFIIVTGDLASVPFVLVYEAPSVRQPQSVLTVVVIITATPSPSSTLSPSLATLDPALLNSTAVLPPNCVLYTLREGDFVGLIAAQYGVTVSDLLAVNNLTEEDAIFLQIGQVLIIPLPGCQLSGQEIAAPTAVLPTIFLFPTLTPTPSPALSLPTPTLPPTAVNSQVQIVEVVNAGDISTEYVTIRNNGAVIDLSGWTLRDMQGNTFEFQAIRLFSNAEIRIYTGGGSNTPIAQYWGLDRAVWSSDDVVILSDPNGLAQSTLSLSPLPTVDLGSPSELLVIPGGTFAMGTTAAEAIQAVNECLAGYGGAAGTCDPAMAQDSTPMHSVQIDTFYLEATEVSYAQFLRFLNQLGAGAHRNGCGGFACAQTRTESETSNISFDGAMYSVPPVINNLPVTNVTWYGAQAYCESIGRRLPTEAEWERAARGDTGFVYPWGMQWDATRANTNRPADTATPLGKSAVTSFPTGISPYGVMNMAGNVAEWVSDWYDSNYYGNPTASAPNPTGPASGSVKVVRGGSWDAVPFFARTVHRMDRSPVDPTAWIGFRCAADTVEQ